MSCWGNYLETKRWSRPCECRRLRDAGASGDTRADEASWACGLGVGHPDVGVPRTGCARPLACPGSQAAGM